MAQPEKPQSKIHAAVIGVGSLGQHHARVYTQIPGVKLVGVADCDEKRVREVAKRCHCQPFVHYQELLSQVDVASVVVPTHLHFRVARDCLEQGVALLLEKPMTCTLEEADALIRLAKNKEKVLQIGHIERFNQAIQEVKRRLYAPRFIEVHRLGPFSRRNTDIGVTLDLMIHDLDIILDLVGSPVERLEAVGVSIFTEHEDIANARLTLANGCVANINASRVTMDQKRKIRIFSPEHYISIDYQKQELYIYRLKKNAQADVRNFMQLIERERLVFGTQEPLYAELSAFITAVREGGEPVVSGEQGRQALAVALEISEQIKKQNYVVRP
ncbi:Gfo/Idh/MocA family oxidoreductase [candidate division FCPU426 bacterium]|nr:Gfo/Idh/MocA family oxidoreductase [candidate division FCPU426 bacterium]